MTWTDDRLRPGEDRPTVADHTKLSIHVLQSLSPICYRLSEACQERYWILIISNSSKGQFHIQRLLKGSFQRLPKALPGIVVLGRVYIVDHYHHTLQKLIPSSSKALPWSCRIEVPVCGRWSKDSSPSPAISSHGKREMTEISSDGVGWKFGVCRNDGNWLYTNKGADFSRFCLSS